MKQQEAIARQNSPRYRGSVDARIPRPIEEPAHERGVYAFGQVAVSLLVGFVAFALMAPWLDFFAVPAGLLIARIVHRAVRRFHASTLLRDDVQRMPRLSAGVATPVAVSASVEPRRHEARRAAES